MTRAKLTVILAIFGLILASFVLNYTRKVSNEARRTVAEIQDLTGR